MIRPTFSMFVSLILAAIVLPGCFAPQTPPDVAIAPGAYTTAFDAARDTLTRYQFELERVDARAGVITTRPKNTAGLATPWDLDQSTLTQEWEDFVNDQHRIVRITFEEVSVAGSDTPPPALAAAGETDLREVAGPLTAHVDVVLERVQHTDYRIEPSAVRFSSITQDPEMIDRGMWPTYAVAFSQDPLLARRLAADIRDALPKPAPIVTPANQKAVDTSGPTYVPPIQGGARGQ